MAIEVKLQKPKDIRDMRDPRSIGEAIIKRSKNVTALQAADRIELTQMPKYS
jgi:hypothetical protein